MFFRDISFLALPILAGLANVQAAATDGPIVNLGAAGMYKGILQNNSTVESSVLHPSFSA